MVKFMKKTLKNILALLLGCILAFFIMEGVLRVYNPLDFRVKGDKIVLPANKKYVIRKYQGKSNLHEKYIKFDETIIHTKNSLGFRGEEPLDDFSGYLTIIAVGGSTTECTFLSDPKTWTEVLKNKLDRDFENIWINNAGFDGHSTFGHIVLMEDYIVKLKPDIVLFLIGANDQGRDDLGEYDSAMMKDKISLQTLKQFLKSMANHSEVFSLGLNMYRYYKSKVIGVEHAAIDFERFRNVDIDMHYASGKKIFETQTIPSYKTKLSKPFEDRLKNLINISKNNNIEPVLVTQPTLYGDFIDDVTGINFKFTNHSWDYLELYNDTTRQVGIKENILVIDLAREMPKSSKYYYDWFHFTNEGAEKAAEIIYNKLSPYIASKYSESE